VAIFFVFGFIYNVESLQTVGIVVVTILLTDSSRYFWNYFEERRTEKNAKRKEIQLLQNKISNFVYHSEKLWRTMVGDFVTIEIFDELHSFVKNNISTYAEILEKNELEKITLLYQKMTELYIYDIKKGEGMEEVALDQLGEVLELSRTIIIILKAL